MDPVVEHGEIGLGRPGAGAEQERHLREFLGGAARLALGRERVAEDELIAAGGVFAHDAAEIGGLHLLRPFVFDAELLLGLLQGDVDLVVPRLLDRRGEDRGDLELLVLREGHARQRGGDEPHAADLDDIAARKPRLRFWLVMVLALWLKPGAAAS